MPRQKAMTTFSGLVAKRMSKPDLLFLARHQEGELHVLYRGEDRDQVIRLEDEPHLLRPKARPSPVGHPPDGLAVHPDLAIREVVEA